MAKRIILCIVMCLLFCSMVSTALAAPSIEWNTDRVYFENQDTLVIEGFFYNKGTNTIKWVNWHNIKVYFKQTHSNWWLAADGNFTNLNVYLEPGDSVNWTFRITNVGYCQYDYYNVKWKANYNYE